MLGFTPYKRSFKGRMRGVNFCFPYVSAAAVEDKRVFLCVGPVVQEGGFSLAMPFFCFFLAVAALLSTVVAAVVP